MPLSPAEYARQWRANNKERIRNYRLSNIDKCRARSRDYYERNAPHLRHQKVEYRALNLEKARAANRVSYRRRKEKDHERQLDYGRRYRKRHLEKERLRGQKYYARNREKVLARQAKNEKLKRLEINERRRRIYYSDPCYRIKRNFARRLKALRKRNLWSEQSQRLVGCDRHFLRAYLGSQFTPGMTWENYGKWVVDHIIPCADFDLSKSEEQRKCFHYSNLRPLWFKANAAKGAKSIGLHQARLL